MFGFRFIFHLSHYRRLTWYQLKFFWMIGLGLVLKIYFSSMTDLITHFLSSVFVMTPNGFSSFMTFPVSMWCPMTSCGVPVLSMCRSPMWARWRVTAGGQSTFPCSSTIPHLSSVSCIFRRTWGMVRSSEVCTCNSLPSSTVGCVWLVGIYHRLFSVISVIYHIAVRCKIKLRLGRNLLK